MSIAKVVAVSHVARETSDVNRLAEFYKEIFGFEEVEVNADFGDFKVIWLNHPTASFQFHFIERNSETKLPEGPFSATSAVADPTHLPRGHHIAFSVTNYDFIVHKLKEKGIEIFVSSMSLPNRKVRQIFFFDPDGNGLEIASEETPQK